MLQQVNKIDATCLELSVSVEVGEVTVPLDQQPCSSRNLVWPGSVGQVPSLDSTDRARRGPPIVRGSTYARPPASGKPVRV